MIASAIQSAHTRESPWHAGFLSQLPTIQRYASVAFRHLSEEAQEEAITETVANALVAYVRLCELGKAALAYPTVLARYAIRQIYAGRRVGMRQNIKDVYSAVAQKRNGFSIERLHRFDSEAGEWIEATIDDDQTPVPDQAAFRCDFPAWLDTNGSRNRRIAEALALGHSGLEVSQRFKISQARVCQLRRELQESWQAFHGDATKSAAVRR